MSNFPEKVWDGCSSSRPNLMDTCAPGHNDWCAIVTELQATQRYLLDLADNLKTMPNLRKAIKNGEDNVASFLTKVEKMALPIEFERDITEIRKRVDGLENLNKKLDALVCLVQALQQQLFALTADYQKFKDNVEKCAQGAENRTRLRVNHFEEATNKRVEELAVRVNEISKLLAFQPIS